MRQITSDNIVHMEKRATNKFGLFLVFLAVIAIFGGGGFLLYKYRDHIDWNLKLPWEKIIDKKDEADDKKENSTNDKKKNKELVIPRIKSNGIILNETTINIVDIKADDRGYIFEVALVTNHDWAIVNVESVLIDGYYTTASFGIRDNKDIGEQVPTTTTFRITKTELDKYNINGFNSIAFFYSHQFPHIDNPSKLGVIQFGNEIQINNGHKGLIKVDQKGSLLIEYYKTVKADDATYIYFEAKNEDIVNNREILIKKLMINNRIYEMPEFKEVAYRGSRILFSIKIPKEKIKVAEEITVSFFIINKGSDDNTKAVYVTNEYTRKL